MRLFIALVAIFVITQVTHGQTGYTESRYYVKKGGQGLVCGPTYIVPKYADGLTWNEGWQNCRKRQWYQERYSGYVYFWQYSQATGRYSWYREWREGFFWYFRWYDYQQRVW